MPILKKVIHYRKYERRNQMRYIELKDGAIYNFENMKVMGILNATKDSFIQVQG